MTVAWVLSTTVPADVRAVELQRVVIIRNDDVAVYVDVEWAVSAGERSRGLMWRNHLPPRAGMMFDFGASGSIAMWMKNTRISLDMLFLDAAGVIVDIEPATEPGSTRVIRSSVPSRYVLEINAGEAGLYGISSGDEVHWQ